MNDRDVLLIYFLRFPTFRIAVESCMFRVKSHFFIFFVIILLKKIKIICKLKRNYKILLHILSNSMMENIRTDKHRKIHAVFLPFYVVLMMYETSREEKNNIILSQTICHIDSFYRIGKLYSIFTMKIYSYLFIR